MNSLRKRIDQEKYREANKLESFWVKDVEVNRTQNDRISSILRDILKIGSFDVELEYINPGPLFQKKSEKVMLSEYCKDSSARIKTNDKNIVVSGSSKGILLNQAIAYHWSIAEYSETKYGSPILTDDGRLWSRYVKAYGAESTYGIIDSLGSHVNVVTLGSSMIPNGQHYLNTFSVNSVDLESQAKQSNGIFKYHFIEVAETILSELQQKGN